MDLRGDQPRNRRDLLGAMLGGAVAASLWFLAATAGALSGIIKT